MLQASPVSGLKYPVSMSIAIASQLPRDSTPPPEVMSFTRSMWVCGHNHGDDINDIRSISQLLVIEKKTQQCSIPTISEPNRLLISAKFAIHLDCIIPRFLHSSNQKISRKVKSYKFLLTCALINGQSIFVGIHIPFCRLATSTSY